MRHVKHRMDKFTGTLLQQPANVNTHLTEIVVYLIVQSS